jgi:uncharacterized protein YlxW (UPF0749 family)
VNPFEMVVLIVAMVMVASIIRAKYGYPRGRRGRDRDDSLPAAEERAETMRLREEVKALKDRIHVLERIAVEKENTLSREIENLRDQ